MPSKSRGAYAATDVPVSRSAEQIKAMTRQHGGVAWQVTELPEVHNIVFGWTRGGKNYAVKIPLKMDYSWCKTDAHRAQEERTKWRALMYYMKAVFDAVDKGIVLQEQAFLGDMVLKLPNGGTARAVEAFLPQIAEGQAVNVAFAGIMLDSGGQAVQAEIVSEKEIQEKFGGRR